jgi:hypothetical protein
VLAVHTSVVDPLPHQITAVYEAMLPRQPLRFLLADDPGAGKTIMAGLLMKELIARGEQNGPLHRNLLCAMEETYHMPPLAKSSLYTHKYVSEKNPDFTAGHQADFHEGFSIHLDAKQQSRSRVHPLRAPLGTEIDGARRAIGLATYRG